MKPYSVEIFDRSLSFRSHYEIDDLGYKFDYLDPERNTVTLPATVECDTDDYIWLTRGTEKIFGIITGISDKENSQRDVAFTDFAQLFDVDITIDTAQLGTGYLETYVANQIRNAYGANADSSQNIPGLTVTPTNRTAAWALDIEPESDDTTMAVVNLFDDIILPAFQQYEIVVTAQPAIMEKTIRATVETNADPEVTIEADLSSILAKEISIRKKKKEINKLIVYNKKDFSMSATYYLHSSGTYNTSNSDRVLPVSYKIATVSTKNTAEYEESESKDYENAINRIVRIQKKSTALTDADKDAVKGAVATLNKISGINLAIGSDGKVTSWNEDSVRATVEGYTESYQFETDCRALATATFNEKAKAKADSTFSANKYENLIELEVLPDDSLVKPGEMNTGQRAVIIHEGMAYSTALTGWTKRDTTLLTFGNMRLELTKILKGRA